MPYKYTYKSGETFSYKWWHIKIENQFGGITKISFSIDGLGICMAINSVCRESGAIKNNQISSTFEASLSNAVALRNKIIDSITVHHVGFSYWEKCRKDAEQHIDTVLGDGLSYAKKHNLYPSLSTFL